MSITTALETILAISNLTKAIISDQNIGEVKAIAIDLNDKITELQSVIFTLQAENHELLDANRDLRNEQVKAAQWENTKSRYKMNPLCAGVLVYTLKAKHQTTEPLHHICPNCYENNHRSILTGEPPRGIGRTYVCCSPKCGAKFINHDESR